MNAQRVFLFDQTQPKLREFPGNKEPMLGRWYIERGKPLDEGSGMSAAMVNQLPPGAMLPWHVHSEDEEAYFFISGQGAYLDNEKKEHAVKSGDAAFCLKGEGHGLKNTGAVPLLFCAVIVKK